MNGIKIKFWGVRGSFPIPRSDDRFGGNTSCVEIRSNNDVIVFDMGTGLRDLGNSILKNDESITDINIILSHYHYDHVLGFLMFMPLFDERYNVNIYAPGDSDNEIETKFQSFLNSSFWPVEMSMFAANISFNHYTPSGSFNISDNIKIISSPHGHPGGANSLRVEIDRFSVTYVTDCEHPNSHLNQNVIDISMGTDILIHDAQYTPQQLPNHKGWGHSSWEQCVGVAKSAKVKKLALFHHNPDHGNAALDKIEQDAKNVFSNTLSAKEGMEIFIPEQISEAVIS